jgi:hypothetical protein
MNAFFSSWYDLRRRLPNSEESASLALLAGVSEDVVRRWFTEGSESRTESRTVIAPWDSGTEKWGLEALDPELAQEPIYGSSTVIKKHDVHESIPTNMVQDFNHYPTHYDNTEQLDLEHVAGQFIGPSNTTNNASPPRAPWSPFYLRSSHASSPLHEFQYATTLSDIGTPDTSDGEQAYRCSYPGCPYTGTFKRKYELQRHERKHDQSQQQRCLGLECDKQFYRLDKLWDHISGSHALFRCPVLNCPTSPGSLREILVHFDEHPESVKTECRSSFGMAYIQEHLNDYFSATSQLSSAPASMASSMFTFRSSSSSRSKTAKKLMNCEKCRKEIPEKNLRYERSSCAECQRC